MRKTVFVLAVATSLLFVACSGGGATSSPAGGESPATSPEGSAAASPAESAATGEWDPNSINGTAILSGWRSSPEEGEALTQALLASAQYPNIQVDYQPIAGDYRT
jgi:ABC-type glycerol-3-phosphate transport system substrate-binding protein